MSLTRLAPILALVATFAAPLGALAQTTATPAPAVSGAPMTGQPHHHRRRGPSMMHALRSLNLTDAQKQQVAAFHSQEQQANQNADGPTKEANAKKMRGQIMGILTPDQKTQLHSAMHARRSPSDASAPDPATSPAPQ